MTLIIYLKCANATILISDRKQNDPIANHSQGIRKYFLPNHQEYVIALSGDGTRVDTITTPLDIEQTSTNNVKEKIKSIVEISKGPSLGTAEGFLLLINKKPFEFYHVWTTIDKLGINHDNPQFECYGEGATLGKYLLHKFDLSGLPWNIAIQYLVSIMQEVAEHNDSVGILDKFGFDYLIILDNGEVKSGIFDKNFTIPKIEANFTPDDSFKLDTITKKPTIQKPNVIEATTKKENQKEPSKETYTKSKTNAPYPQIKGISKISSLIVQSDKSVYAYGNNIIVSIIHPKPTTQSPIVLKVMNKHKKIIFKTLIPVETGTNGIYHLVIPVKGKEWQVRGEEFKIIAEHGEKLGSNSIWRSDFGATLELDQKVYTWTDKVYITVVAPDYSLDKDSPSYIGQHPDEKITITTSKGEISNYKLIETGKNTGIFIGEICLTGFKGHPSKECVAEGITAGSNSGPNDGKIACADEDYLSISFTTMYDTVIGSALIRWNIGEIQWLEANYSAESVGCVRIIDPDMNLNPNKIDEFKIQVRSDSDTSGLWIIVRETNEASGVFEGRVRFSTKKSDDCLLIKDGDAITAEYNDKTLPSPYTLKDELSITATSIIGTIFPPLERVSIKNWRITNDECNTVETLEVKQKVNISTVLVNLQQKSQPFVLLADIKDESGTTVQNPSISGSLASNEKIFLDLPWAPQYPGNYSIRLFVWENIDNPAALSTVIPLNIQVNEIANKISVPLGTSVPGCEQQGRCFLPPLLKIKKDQSVIWINDDTAAHTITSGTPQNGPDGNFDSGLFLSGGSFTSFFKNKGICPYFCMVHPWQTGTIVVE